MEREKEARKKTKVITTKDKGRKWCHRWKQKRMGSGVHRAKKESARVKKTKEKKSFKALLKQDEKAWVNLTLKQQLKNT